jgi:hypothetical protein
VRSGRWRCARRLLIKQRRSKPWHRHRQLLAVSDLLNRGKYMQMLVSSSYWELQRCDGVVHQLQPLGIFLCRCCRPVLQIAATFVDMAILSESTTMKCRCNRARRPRQHSHACCVLLYWQTPLSSADAVSRTQQGAARWQDGRATATAPAATAAAAAADIQGRSLCCRGGSWRLRSSSNSTKGARREWAQYARGQATQLAGLERQHGCSYTRRAGDSAAAARRVSQHVAAGGTVIEEAG